MTTKTFTIYKTKLGEWYWEHSLKGTNKVRRQLISGSISDCILRFENKGYVFIDRYGYNRKDLIQKTLIEVLLK